MTMTCSTTDRAVPLQTVPFAYRDRFLSDGYIVIPGFLTDAEVEAIREECSFLVEDAIAKTPGAYNSSEWAARSRGCIFETLPSSSHPLGTTTTLEGYRAARRAPPLRAGAADVLLGQKMQALVSAMLGCDPYLYNDQYIVKPGGSRTCGFALHRDSDWCTADVIPGATYSPYISVWCALDDAGAHNGGLEVVPNSSTAALPPTPLPPRTPQPPPPAAPEDLGSTMDAAAADGAVEEQERACAAANQHSGSADTSTPTSINSGSSGSSGGCSSGSVMLAAGGPGSEHGGAATARAATAGIDAAAAGAERLILQLSTPAGTAVVFNDRLLHRSGPNPSHSTRHAWMPQFSAEPILASPDGPPLSFAVPLGAGSNCSSDGAGR